MLREKKGHERTSMIDLVVHEPHPINNDRFLKVSCFLLLFVCFFFFTVLAPAIYIFLNFWVFCFIN